MAEGDREAVLAAYGDYFRTFQALDAESVLAYYEMPCLLLSSQGVVVVTTASEARTLFANMMAGLKARGYGRSEWERLGVRFLGETTAMLSTRVIRQTTDGRELERFGATYTLRRTEAGWKIVVLVIHDADRSWT